MLSCQSRSRAGFTLIELMVSMTLTLVIMAILSEAFVLGLNTFGKLKGLGDMQQNLRTATVLLQNDLGSSHFEGSRKLSDNNISASGSFPQSGFFAVRQGTTLGPPSTTYVSEGNDRNALPSYRAADHILHLTSRRAGNRQESFFTTALSGSPTSAPALANFFATITAYNMAPSQLSDVTLALPYNSVAPLSSQGFYSSQWAEVFYYLVATGTYTDPTSATLIPTYSLYRAQFVMVPDSTKLANLIPNTELALAASPPVQTFAGMACNPGANPATKLTFYSPTDAAAGLRTINPTTLTLPVASTDLQWARLSVSSTLVLPNVVSFQVQVMPANVSTWNNSTSYIPGNLVVSAGATYSCLANNTGQALANAAFWKKVITSGSDFIDIPANATGNWYDTTSFSSSAAFSNNYGLGGIQVTMRVWDTATRQTRQITVTQDL